MAVRPPPQGPAVQALGLADRVEIRLDAATLWRAAITLMRLFLGAWMLNSGYSYWAQRYGLPPAFPQPFGTLPASNQMLVTMIEVGLFNFVKVCEIVGGLCLIFGVFVPAATLLLLPVLSSSGIDYAPSDLLARADWDQANQQDLAYFGSLLAALSVGGDKLEPVLAGLCGGGSPLALALDVADARTKSYDLVRAVNLAAIDLGIASPISDAGAKYESGKNYKKQVLAFLEREGKVSPVNPPAGRKAGTYAEPTMRLRFVP